MQRSALFIALLAATTLASAAPWTYRGTLNDGGKPANGAYDLRLTLVNAAGTASVSEPITLNQVDVKDGNFAAEVDFGVDLSQAPAMKLQTEVQQNGSGFASLGEPTRFDPKAALAGICWDTTGNVVAAGEFLGSTNGVPLVLKAGNTEVLRMTGGLLDATANIVAGAPTNSVIPAFIGQVVAGGGNGSGPNRTSANYATVSGGVRNFASGDGASVGGGADNSASGFVSTVSGGTDNTATGIRSAVSGGISNCAGGDYSWAGGFRARIRSGNEAGDGPCAANSSGDADGDNGTFVWADDQGVFFTSTGPRQFLVRAQGGMAINTNTPTAGAALTVTGGNVSIPAPGTLNFGSTTRQMLNLFESSNYGIGIQTAVLYNRVDIGGNFAWYQGGSHNDAQSNPGPGGIVRMTLDADGQLRTTTGTIATLSDARLKHKVADYTGALDQISALRPVHYEYKDAGQSFQPPGEHLGFIAQEVQQVFPQWVSTDEAGHLMLSLRGFEAVAVRAMQELRAENAELKAENAAQNARLSAENAELKAENAAQNARLNALEKAR